MQRKETTSTEHARARLLGHGRARHWLAALLLGLLAGTLGACGAAEIQPLTFEPAAWTDGELSEYRVTDTRGEFVGTLRFAIQQGAAADEWQILREIVGPGTQDSVTVLVQGNGFRPQHADLIRVDSRGEEQIRTVYSGSQADLELTTRQDITTYERISITSDVRDEATVLMLVRALPLAQDYATRVNVFTPILGSMERMTIEVVERETITTEAGEFDSWRVTVEGRDRSLGIEAWVAVDAPHPVVKFIDGRNRGTFELVDFQTGNP
ncbi:MAG: DUF3108 domain-containing protein [Litorilinea sp.]